MREVSKKPNWKGKLGTGDLKGLPHHFEEFELYPVGNGEPQQAFKQGEESPFWFPKYHYVQFVLQAGEGRTVGKDFNDDTAAVWAGDDRC